VHVKRSPFQWSESTWGDLRCIGSCLQWTRSDLSFIYGRCLALLLLWHSLHEEHYVTIVVCVIVACDPALGRPSASGRPTSTSTRRPAPSTTTWLCCSQGNHEDNLPSHYRFTIRTTFSLYIVDQEDNLLPLTDFTPSMSFLALTQSYQKFFLVSYRVNQQEFFPPPSRS
jgi:hypothetical protein